MVEPTGDVMRRCRLRWHGLREGMSCAGLVVDYVKACRVLCWWSRGKRLSAEGELTEHSVGRHVSAKS